MLEPILMSRTEAKVVTLLFQGKGITQIATELGIKQGTVKLYLHRVYEKAGVDSAIGLVALA
jgi:DNA-binding NarL/FixJ family response regulator